MLLIYIIILFTLLFGGALFAQDKYGIVGGGSVLGISLIILIIVFLYNGIY